MTEPTKPELFGIRYGVHGIGKTIQTANFSDNEPIRFNMRQNLLPQIQGKTLSFNFGAINEVMEALKPIYDSFPFKRTLRQQRIISFNRWVDLTNTKEVIPGGEFEEEIMKGRAPLIFKPFPCSN